MSPEDFLERLLTIRSRYRREVKEATDRAMKVHALAEQMNALGFNPSIGDHFDRETMMTVRPQFEHDVTQAAANETRKLVDEFMAFEWGVYTSPWRKP